MRILPALLVIALSIILTTLADDDDNDDDDGLQEVLTLAAALADDGEANWFDSSWLRNSTTLTMMMHRMRTPGEFIHLERVLKPHLAERLWEELREESIWEHHVDVHFMGVPPPLRTIDATVCPRLHEWMDRRQYAPRDNASPHALSSCSDQTILDTLIDHLASLSGTTLPPFRPFDPFAP
jgi:hypothetical protein